jgi:hypothetical protein
MTLDQYIDNINKRYTLGNATEHTFRGDLQQLIESLVPEHKSNKRAQKAIVRCSRLHFNPRAKFPLDLLKPKTLAIKTLKEQRKQETKNSLTVIKKI